jgi:hypothetical protein
VRPRQHVAASALRGTAIACSAYCHCAHMRLCGCTCCACYVCAHLSSRCWKQQPAHRVWECVFLWSMGGTACCGGWVSERAFLIACLAAAPLQGCRSTAQGTTGVLQLTRLQLTTVAGGWAQHLCLGMFVNHIVGTTYTRAPVDCVVRCVSIQALTMPKEVGWCLWLQLCLTSCHCSAEVALVHEDTLTAYFTGRCQCSGRGAARQLCVGYT